MKQSWEVNGNDVERESPQSLGFFSSDSCFSGLWPDLETYLN